MQKTYLELIRATDQYSIVYDWRSELLSAELVWAEYAKSIGAVQFWAFPYCSPSSFRFEGDPPKGWTKPGSHGQSRPMKRNSAAIAELTALPQPRHLDRVAVELGLPLNAEWATGWARLGHGFNVWSPAWVGDRIWMVGPDWLEQLAGIQKDVPEAKLDRGDGGIPPGFELSTKARFELASAQAKVDREEVKSRLN